MGYCTEADLTTRLGSAKLIELTSDSGSSVNSAVVTAAIARSSATMDADLSFRYAVPVVTTGDTELTATLKNIAIDLCEYFLFQRRGLVSGAKQGLYDNAKKWLEDIREGAHPLPATEGTPASADASPPAVLFGFQARSASRENMAKL